MLRDRAADNVIQFPGGDLQRLERAIDAFDSGDPSHALLSEFAALADKKIHEANYFLGCMYEDGSNGATASLQKALQCYQATIDALGYVEGYLAVARLLYHGKGAGQDYPQAFKYYLHVAEKRAHPVACFMVGRMFQRGEGTNKDAEQARAWYEKAVSQGSIFGMLNLAMLEAEEGRSAKSLCLRLRAGFKAFAIALRDRRDIRLRGG